MYYWEISSVCYNKLINPKYILVLCVWVIYWKPVKSSKTCQKQHFEIIVAFLPSVWDLLKLSNIVKLFGHVGSNIYSRFKSSVWLIGNSWKPLNSQPAFHVETVVYDLLTAAISKATIIWNWIAMDPSRIKHTF